MTVDLEDASGATVTGALSPHTLQHRTIVTIWRDIPGHRLKRALGRLRAVRPGDASASRSPPLAHPCSK